MKPPEGGPHSWHHPAMSTSINYGAGAYKFDTAHIEAWARLVHDMVTGWVDGDDGKKRMKLTLETLNGTEEGEAVIDLLTTGKSTRPAKAREGLRRVATVYATLDSAAS